MLNAKKEKGGKETGRACKPRQTEKVKWGEESR